MDKVVYFDNENQKVDRCVGQVYYDFLDYAFEQSDYFMLVYVNYYGKGYSKVMNKYKKELKTYQIKSRTNPRWPGTLNTFSKNSTYKIVFYRNSSIAKEVLKQVDKLSDWSSPLYPQDLAFFKGNRCWFYSVGHEKIGAFIHATEKDIDFVISKNLANVNDVFVDNKNFFDAYDEELDI